MSTIPKASMANWLREQVILGARCTICGIVIDSDPAADDDRCTSHPGDAKDEEEAYLMSAAEELYSLFAKTCSFWPNCIQIDIFCTEQHCIKQLPELSSTVTPHSQPAVQR